MAELAASPAGSQDGAAAVIASRQGSRGLAGDAVADLLDRQANRSRERLAYKVLAETLSPQPLFEGPASRAAPRNSVCAACRALGRRRLADCLRAASAGVVHARGELRNVLLRRQTPTAALRRLNRISGRLRVGHAIALTAAGFHAVSLVHAATAAKADVQAALRRQDRDARRALAGSVRLRLHPPEAPQAAGADPPTTEAAPVSLPPQPAPGPATVRDIGGDASAAHYQDFYTI